MVSTRQMTTTTSSSNGSSTSSSSNNGGSGSASTSSASTAMDDMSTADLDLASLTGVLTSNGATAGSFVTATAPSSDAMATVDGWTSANVEHKPQQQQQLFAQGMTGTTAVAVPRPLFAGVRRYAGGVVAVRSRATDRVRPTNLLDLPMEMLEEIFSYVGYKKVSQIRVVSKQMNFVCSGVLNSTFAKLSTSLMNRFKVIKNKMPRRESSRRTHPLSHECDIVETCYMRVSLLQMTFGKYIDRKHLCFFAGAILDEVFLILRKIRNSPNIRPHMLTEELYDLSTMAMEYFKEHLEPRLPRLVPIMVCKAFVDHSKNNTKTKFLLNTSPGSVGGGSGGVGNGTDSDAKSSLVLDEDDDIVAAAPPQSNMVLRKGIRKIKQGMKRYNNQLTVLRNDLRYTKRKAADQHKAIGELQKLVAEQQKQTVEYAARLDENDKKNEEMSMKISALLQESNKCKTELQYWRSTGHAPVADLAPLADAELDQQLAAVAGPALLVAPAGAAIATDAQVAPEDNMAAALAAVAAPSNGHQSRPRSSSEATATVEQQVQIVASSLATDQNTTTGSVAVAGGKRKADVAQLTDSGPSSSVVGGSVISSDGGVGVVVGCATGAVAEAPSQQQQPYQHGSDIIKKARRVQSKARGQHPLSISSSSSNNSGPLGGSGNSSSSSSSGGNNSYVTSNIQSSGNHSSNAGSGAAGGKSTRSK